MWDPSWSLKRRPKSSHREQSLNTSKSKHPSENCIVMNSKYHISFSLDTIFMLKTLQASYAHWSMLQTSHVTLSNYRLPYHPRAWWPLVLAKRNSHYPSANTICKDTMQIFRANSLWYWDVGPKKVKYLSQRSWHSSFTSKRHIIKPDKDKNSIHRSPVWAGLGLQRPWVTFSPWSGTICLIVL